MRRKNKYKGNKGRGRKDGERISKLIKEENEIKRENDKVRGKEGQGENRYKGNKVRGKKGGGENK